MTPRTIPVLLYGDMRKRFGRRFDLAVSNAAEAIRALCVIKPGFREYLQERLDSPFRVLIGEDALDKEGLSAPVGKTEVIKIVPVVSGAKSGLGQVLLGAVLIAAAVAVPYLAFEYGGIWSSIMATSALTVASGVGWSMVLGGISQLLASNPSTDFNPGANNDMETFSFGSPTMTTGQGGCVPLGYGRMRVGGHVISAGIESQAWQVKGFGQMAPDDNGTMGGNGDTSPWVWAIAP